MTAAVFALAATLVAAPVCQDQDPPQGGPHGRAEPAAEPLMCTTGELFAGDPRDANVRNEIRDGDPAMGASLPWLAPVVHGNSLVTHAWSVVWQTDVTAREPVLRRVAGTDGPSDRMPDDLLGHVLRRPAGDSGRSKFSAGGCLTTARFMRLSGLAALPNGDLALADFNANAVVQVRDPFGATCAVEYVAGTVAPMDSLPDHVLQNQGAADGPGARATFRGLSDVVAGADGELFVLDEGNRSVRRIGADRDRTVSTVAVVPESWTATSMTWLRRRLYITAVGSGSEAALLEVDTGNGAIRTVVSGGAEWGTRENRTAGLTGAATDGTGIFAVNHGRIFHISPAGEIRHIAGNGTTWEYTGDYDPLVRHAALDLQLRNTRGQFLAYHAGHLYYATPSYVLRIACR